MISVPDEELVDLDGPTEEPEAQAEHTDDEQPEQAPSFTYRDCEQWLQELALPHYLRKLDGTRKWAPNWFDYPEADTLVQALWVTWEQMKLDGPQAILVYYRDYFYPLMDRLTSPDGPFHAYDETTHPQLPDQWPTGAAPVGHFPQVEM